MLESTRTQRLLLLVLVTLLAGIGVVLVTSAQSRSGSAAKARQFDGPTMPPGLHATNFVLTDQHGRRVSLAQYRGRVVMLTFIHSLCHDACPLIVEQMKGALNQLPNAGASVPAIGVTVAPAEDTPANRRRFLDSHRMDSRLQFVNGSLNEVRRVWHAYAIAPGAAPGAHSAFVILIDKKGIERVGFAADQLTPEGLAHDVRALQAEPA